MLRQPLFSQLSPGNDDKYRAMISFPRRIRNRHDFQIIFNISGNIYAIYPNPA